jgi:hypothetical protein
VVKVLKSVRSRKFLAALSALAAVAAMLVGARVAVADSIWYQSYQRGSATEACVAQAGETPWQDSWGTNPGWSPSWEQWANNGQGGWVCSRSITWARDSAALVYNVGDIGPGGGLVFLISGGLTYEMAPKTWGANETTGIQWCSDTTTSIAGAVDTAVGTGSANTTAMLNLPCTSGAAVAARAYVGGGFTDWFLPSQDELNEMWLYSQVGGFNTATYGLASVLYWSSTQLSSNTAQGQNFINGSPYPDPKNSLSLRVRPVRAF